MILIIAIFLSIAFIVCGIMLYAKHQLGKIPSMSFSDVLAYTTKDNPKVVVSVGIIKDGKNSYKVYGQDSMELSPELHTYEIGSITKTFTATLINKAIKEGKIKLDDTLDKFFDFPKDKNYPTVKDLLTHTSGYKSHYYAKPMTSNFFKNRNSFYGVTKQSVLDKASKLNIKKEDYKFEYSNYGFAILGLILESVYKTEYATLLNKFVQDDLQMSATKISDKTGDFGNYWDWEESDAYLSAGAITSNIEDMLLYAKMQVEKNPIFVECHKSLKTVNASNEMHKSMGIIIDEVGMSWMIDNENNLVWHNGATSNYNSYLGFNLSTGTAVVILSNLSPNEKIPATVLGVKLLKELDSMNQ